MIEPDPVREQREREHAGEAVHVLHPRRQVARLRDLAVVEIRLQREHVVQRELASKQVPAQRHALVLQRPAKTYGDRKRAG